MKKILFGLLLMASSVMAQSVIFQPLQTNVVPSTHEHLRTFDLMSTDVTSIQKMLDEQSSNVKYITIQMGTKRLDLQLFEYSFLNHDYRLNVGSKEGMKTFSARKDFRTFRGYIHGNNQSKVSFYIANDFLKIMVDDNQDRYYIEPLDLPSRNKALTTQDQFIGYYKSDILTRKNNFCSVQYGNEMPMHQHVKKQVEAAAVARPCNPCAEVKIALGCDFSFFVKYGMSVAACENQMLTTMADVQTVFDDEFENEYVYQVTGLYVPDDPSKDDFFILRDINQMLNQFVVSAPTMFSGSFYHCATLWTAKFGITAAEVGAAFQAQICNGSNPYTVCSDFLPPGGRQDAYLTLQAHMLGHLWNMVHDPFTGATIMAPGIPSPVRLWSFLSKDALNAYVRDGKMLGNCLDICPNSSAPVPDFASDVTYGCQPLTVKFKDLSLNTTKWKWRFPGGMPDSSELQNPVVVYKAAGRYPVILEAGNQRCEVLITKSDFIEVNDVPVADFTWGIQGREVFFIDQSLRATSYLWNFGDGEMSEEMSPYHEYYTDSTYTVTLTVMNDCGVHTLKKTLKIESVPTAGFEADTIGACAPGSIHFNDMSTPNVRNWQWEFPGGTPSVSTQKNPVVRYDLPGKYDVKLTVYSSRFNSSLTKKEYIIIDSVPVANFSHKINVGQVDFTSNARYAKEHFWIFGDNTTSAEANPSHLYKEGTYEVCYVAINSCGTDTLKTQFTIGVVPTPAFQSNRQTGCAPYQVSFQNTSVAANNYTWYFPGGNPATSNDVNPVVTYPTKGKFDVKLVAKNVFYSDSITKKDFIEVRTKPDADFDVSIAGFKAFFTNRTIDGTNYIWDFGNGKASFLQNPELDYGVEGEFNVRLIVQNSCGTDTLIKKVAVYLIPKVNFAANKVKGCPPFKVQFNDLSSVDVNQWDWQFESGVPATSTEKNPTVTFNKHGKYAVKLTVRNTNGSNALTRVQYIEVQSPIECPEYTNNTKILLDDKIIVPPFGDPNQVELRAQHAQQSKLIPNPAREMVTLLTQATPEHPVQVHVLDCTAQVVLECMSTQESLPIDIGQLAPGLYFVKWQDLQGQHLERLMVLK